MNFRLLIDVDVLEMLDSLPVRRRRSVFDHLRRIQNYPGHYSDHIRPDGDGRRLDVSVFHEFRIVYWTDAADRHIKILALEENE